MAEKTPEKFVVGEKVEFYHGEDRWPVIVFAVNGDEVTAGTHPETAKVFVPRADGKHVALGTPEFAVMPDMIFHPEQSQTVSASKETFRDRLTDRFDRVLDRVLHPFF